MPAPTLVDLEQQIDAELLHVDDDDVACTDCRGVADGQEDGVQPELTKRDRKPAIEVDWMSLDEMVCISETVPDGVTVITEV